ncbi:MAG: LD-carboxypeptidase [Alphaproteobacteria bacterium]|nr:LD-carboxypeptidase [Alphaproteobacteria bacterium]
MTKPIIDIVAPSMPCEPDIVRQCLHMIESWGFTPRYTIAEDSPQSPLGFYSETIRFQQLSDAIYAEDSDIIWALRGGYGLSPFADKLCQIPTPKRKKTFIGFSDNTALHVIATQQWNWQTVHGPVLFQAATNLVTESILGQLSALLRGDLVETVIPALALNEAAQTKRSIHTTVTGGNLSLLQTSIGTAWHVNCQHKILFIEEVNETGYRIDRILHHLRQSGIFEGCQALLVGDIDKSSDRTGEDLAPYVIDTWAQHLPFPVIRLPGFGHGKENGLLPFNRPCTLSLGETPTLTCLFQ